MKPIAKEALLRHLVTVLPKQNREEKTTLLNSLSSQLNIELQSDGLCMKENPGQRILLDDIERLFICRNCMYIQMVGLSLFLVEVALQTGHCKVVCVAPRLNVLQKVVLFLKRKFTK